MVRAPLVQAGEKQKSKPGAGKRQVQGIRDRGSARHDRRGLSLSHWGWEPAGRPWIDPLPSARIRRRRCRPQHATLAWPSAVASPPFPIPPGSRSFLAGTRRRWVALFPLQRA